MACVSVALFIGLWKQQNNVCTLLEHAGIVDWFDSKAFTEKARSLATEYTVPPFYESDEGADDPAVVAFQPYCDALADELTGVYVYGLEDGLYRASSAANIVTHSWFNTIWSLEFKMLGEEIYEIPVAFANGTYLVHVYSYHRILSTYPYLFFCLFISIAVFLGGILLFVHSMTRRIHHIEDAILHMASGELEKPVPPCGGDEIGVVAHELEQLRTTLTEQLRREHEARIANRDLITALSHDLRTPLTILNGYLEVLKHGNQQQQALYVDRCLQKAADLRLLTDHLFDAALVGETHLSAVLQELSLSVFTDALRDNIDFLQTCGFRVTSRLPVTDSQFLADPVMLRRILDNLFSNIIKYGDKSTPVQVTLERSAHQLVLTLQNGVRSDSTNGSHIGLKNVAHMVSLHHGHLETRRVENHFLVSLFLSVDEKFTL